MNKEDAPIFCRRCGVPLYIKNKRIHEFYSPEDYESCKKKLTKN